MPFCHDLNAMELQSRSIVAPLPLGGGGCCHPLRPPATTRKMADTAGAARPPFPPFTEATARQKVAAAEAAWNTKWVASEISSPLQAEWAPPFFPASVRKHRPMPCPTRLRPCRDPDRVAAAYSVDCEWRNRAEFVHGREAVRQVRAGWRACEGLRGGAVAWIPAVQMQTSHRRHSPA